MIALLLDEDGWAEVLEATSPRGAVPSAILLGPGERHLEVPYGTWRDFLGKRVRVAVVQARATATWPEDVEPPNAQPLARARAVAEAGSVEP